MAHTEELTGKAKALLPLLLAGRRTLESGELEGRSFTGTELVEWMLQQPVVSSREDAVSLGKILLAAGVIMHISQEHHFYDLDYRYRFQNFDVSFDYLRVTQEA